MVFHIFLKIINIINKVVYIVCQNGSETVDRTTYLGVTNRVLKRTKAKMFLILLEDYLVSCNHIKSKTAS